MEFPVPFPAGLWVRRCLLYDVAYVRAHLGTADFCAGLDGSGIVDNTNLAIVEASLGDICSNLTGVPIGAAGGPGVPLSLRILPNPAGKSAVLRLELAECGIAERFPCPLAPPR